MPLRLSAVVPATNAPSTLDRCIRAVEGAEEGPDEIIVVTSAGRAGPAAARNEGARSATGDLLVFVDADVVPHRDAFKRIRRTFERDGDLVGLFGSYDDAPPERGVVSGFRNLLHHHVHQQAAGRATTFWAGLGALRRDAFLRAGGFDESRYEHASIEDVELGMRLVDDGARIELDPELLGTHLKSWTFRDMLRTDFSRRGVPWVRLLLERRQRSTALNLGWRHRVSAILVVGAAGALATRRPLGILAAGVSLVALNHRFYALLLRRRGAAQGAFGVVLHVLHHAAGLAAVPAGIAAHVAGRVRRRGATP